MWGNHCFAKRATCPVRLMYLHTSGVELSNVVRTEQLVVGLSDTVAPSPLTSLHSITCTCAGVSPSLASRPSHRDQFPNESSNHKFAVWPPEAQSMIRTFGLSTASA